ncbi:MAG: serine/threonine protein kinase [Acidobacteria bacterium]|nr:serine/threonine protein kinase [Acidobacteriota bacterium]
MSSTPSKIGRYEILELVGRGGMGVLYRAHDPMLERDVALKMMLVDFTNDPAARGRFEREAKAVARLQHRNVVTIHELGDAEGAPYIVMEFLSGKDLDALLRSDQPLSLAQKLDIAAQVCDGLAYAHEQGIVHRDIKPGNIRVLEDGTVKILDFGIAKFAVGSATQTGSILGTPSYMSPEQIMGQPVDGRADLFSVGVLLYELLSGRKPFAGDAPTAVVYQIMHVDPPALSELVPDLPDALYAIVDRALQKNPNERYSRASEMAADLQMTKMMLDLPLNQAGASSAEGTGKLHATVLRERTATGAQQPILNAKMRPSAVEAAADAAPRQRAAESGSRPLVIGAVAAVVIAVAAGAYVMSRGTAETPPAAGPAPSASPASSAPTEPSAASGPAPAASPAGAVTSAAVMIASKPAGAKISVNGQDSGKLTPAAVTVSAGDKLTLALAGYEPSAAAVTDRDVRDGAITFNFSRKTGPVTLVVSGPYAFDLVQGGKVVSQAATRHELTVQPGAAVTARSSEYLLSYAVPLDFGQGRNERQIPPPGTLTVFSAVETCSVMINGRDAGFPPISRKPVAAGSYTVGLKCPDGKSAPPQRVSIAPGGSERVTFGPPQP